MAHIVLQDVSVRFPIIGAEGRSLKKAALAGVLGAGRRGTKVGGRLDTSSHQTAVVEALTDVSLDLGHGARVGLIGHNGAGKTTLLRVLAGIYPPNEGRIHVEGRVTSLLDIALGMDPNASGRENIFLRALYMGRPKHETEAAYEEIAAFTQLGAFLDMPMRTYSAGMQTRLLFAVATAFKADILLLDEGIGAGDAAFAEQAEARMRGFVEEAGILVLASHDTELMRRFCTHAVRLEGGRIAASGSIGELLEHG